MRSSVLSCFFVCGALVAVSCADLIGPAPGTGGASDTSSRATGSGGPTSGVTASNAGPQSVTSSAEASASTGARTDHCFAGPLENPHASRIAIGEDHVCAVRPVTGPGQISVLTCFGRNDKGQVSPDSCGLDICPPLDVNLVAVFGGDSPKAVAAGDRYTCVVSEAGTLACFGESMPGGMGANTTSGFARPSITGVDYVAARGDTTCVMAGSGDSRTLSCFGDNTRGQIDESAINVMTPALVANQAHDVAVGNHFLLFEQLEGSYAQGRSDSDVVSPGSCDATASAPSLLTSCVFANPLQIVAGDDFACMLSAGQSKCWGSIPFLDGSCMAGGCTRPLCECKAGLLEAKRLAAGRTHVCGLQQLATSPHVVCAGEGPGAGSADLTLPFDPIDVAVSHDVSCALGACGQVACWGNGADGQLGNGPSMSADPIVVIP